MLGTPEILIALVVVLLLFGGKKLPEMARGLGQAQREFREGLREGGAGGTETPTAPSPDDGTAHTS